MTLKGCSRLADRSARPRASIWRTRHEDVRPAVDSRRAGRGCRRGSSGSRSCSRPRSAWVLASRESARTEGNWCGRPRHRRGDRRRLVRVGHLGYVARTPRRSRRNSSPPTRAAPNRSASRRRSRICWSCSSCGPTSRACHLRHRRRARDARRSGDGARVGQFPLEGFTTTEDLVKPRDRGILMGFGGVTALAARSGRADGRVDAALGRSSHSVLSSRDASPRSSTRCGRLERAA